MTLIPRGQAKGLTWFIPGEDPTLISKHQIFARIVGALGGRAAEEVIFGPAEVRVEPLGFGRAGDRLSVSPTITSPNQKPLFSPVTTRHSTHPSPATRSPLAPAATSSRSPAWPARW